MKPLEILLLNAPSDLNTFLGHCKVTLLFVLVFLKTNEVNLLNVERFSLSINH